MAALVAAFLAGVLGSPHCVGMCGGFAVAGGGHASDATAWHLGRLGTYAVLGAIAGAAGASLLWAGPVGTVVAAVILVWFAGALAGLLPEPRLKIPGIHRLGTALVARRGPARLVFGALTGLLPCGLVYSVLAIPVAAGDPVVGALTMVVFGLGTVPALALATLGLRRLVARSMWARRGLALGVLAAGLWSVALRSGAWAEPGADGPACHQE